jgi:hypothetical protein
MCHYLYNTIPKTFSPCNYRIKPVVWLPAARPSLAGMRDRFPAPVLLRTARWRRASDPRLSAGATGFFSVPQELH